MELPCVHNHVEFGRMLKGIKIREATLVALMFISTGTLAQQPVIPGAAGFGMNTPAGRGGEIFRVSNLSDDGKGSLRACVEASGPRVCIFEVSGTIRLNGNLNITSPNLTIAGQTAPAPGIMLRDASLVIKASDVLIQHIAVRAMKIAGVVPVKNVVIDHCSISWAIDENLSAFENTDNVTISNSIIAQPLHDSIHSKGAHGFGVLIDSNNINSRFSMVGNLFAHSHARNPRSNAVDFVFVNNVVYNAGAMTVMLYNNPGSASDNSIVGNVFIDGPNTTADLIRLTGATDGDGNNEIILGTRLYLSDNSATGASSDPWSIVHNKSSLSREFLEVTSAPTWPASLQVWPTSGDVALDQVLNGAGSRPADRNSVDAKIVSEVKNQTGSIINCVEADGTSRCAKNAGGWPKLASNVRALSVPSNPNADSDGDGYTNLEEWLHQMAAEVEGRSVAKQPVVTTPKPPEWQD